MDQEELSIKVETVPGNLALDYKCWNCNTTRQKPTCTREECDFCYGIGFQLTDTGRTILEFLRRYSEQLPFEGRNE